MKCTRSLVRQLSAAVTKVRGILNFLAVVSLLFSAANMRAQDDAVHAGADVPPVLKIGSPAPDFTLPGVDGKTHSLKDYAISKVLVVVFNCDHCPVAQMYEQRIKQLVTDYRGRGGALVVIMGHDPRPGILRRA